MPSRAVISGTLSQDPGFKYEDDCSPSATSESKTAWLRPEWKGAFGTWMGKQAWGREGASISQSVSQSISQSDQLVRSVSQSVRSASQSVSQSVSRSASQSISQSVGQSVSQSVSRLGAVAFRFRAALPWVSWSQKPIDTYQASCPRAIRLVSNSRTHFFCLFTLFSGVAL